MNDYLYDNPPQEKDAKREEEIKEMVFRTHLTPQARQRLTNISLVKPALAKSIENLIVSLVASGKLNKMIDEEDLKKILLQVHGSRKREFKIRRI